MSIGSIVLYVYIHRPGRHTCPLYRRIRTRCDCEYTWRWHMGPTMWRPLHSYEAGRGHKGYPLLRPLLMLLRHSSSSSFSLRLLAIFYKCSPGILPVNIQLNWGFGVVFFLLYLGPATAVASWILFRNVCAKWDLAYLHFDMESDQIWHPWLLICQATNGRWFSMCGAGNGGTLRVCVCEKWRGTGNQ